MKINVDWLKESNFDEKYYVKINFVSGFYCLIDSWTDENDIIDIVSRWGGLECLELMRYYTPTHARWINDMVHKLFMLKYKLSGDN